VKINEALSIGVAGFCTFLPMLNGCAWLSEPSRRLCVIHACSVKFGQESEAIELEVFGLIHGSVNQ
jgi:hypothetical protein